MTSTIGGGQTIWPRPEQLLAAVIVFPAFLLMPAGAAYVVAQSALFLWFGEWLSPVDVIALLQPAVRELGWVADPQRWLGVHVIVISPWFGPITFGSGLAAAALSRVIGMWTDD